MSRPEKLTIHNGERARLPFSKTEYLTRLASLRTLMAAQDIEAAVFTSMQNIAYYSGFLYCSFGRPYACVVTAQNCTVVSANIDAGQPWRRSHCDNVVYTDWQHGNFQRAVQGLLGGGRRIGAEFDHLTLEMKSKLETAFGSYCTISDIAPGVMRLRMIKSAEEIDLIRGGAAVADHGGWAIREAVRVGASEIEIAQAGRDVMETEIARRYPDSELRDTWVWFQSGLNTDGAHNPVTTRRLEAGDILSLNTFPMISGYYTALERTLFVGEPSPEHLKVWNVNCAVHRRGLELIRPGAVCADICAELNGIFEEAGLLDRRTFGYGHSFGLLSHYYGREARLELREDIDTVLEPGMVVSMEPMVMVPEGQPGAGGYREHDILVVTASGADNITGFPFGPEHNVIGA